MFFIFSQTPEKNNIPLRYNQVMADRTEASRTCSVIGCGKDVERSLAFKKVEESGLDVGEDAGRKAGLCKEHYKEYKKLTKKDRVLESIGR